MHLPLPLAFKQRQEKSVCPHSLYYNESGRGPEEKLDYKTFSDGSRPSRVAETESLVPINKVVISVHVASLVPAWNIPVYTLREL